MIWVLFLVFLFPFCKTYRVYFMEQADNSHSNHGAMDEGNPDHTQGNPDPWCTEHCVLMEVAHLSRKRKPMSSCCSAHGGMVGDCNQRAVLNTRSIHHGQGAAATTAAASLLDAAVVYSTDSISEVSQVGFSRSPRGGCQLLQKLARCPPEEEGLLQPLALLEGGLLQPLALL
jgi:hypothetical protein